MADVWGFFAIFYIISLVVILSEPFYTWAHIVIVVRVVIAVSLNISELIHRWDVSRESNLFAQTHTHRAWAWLH